MKLIPKTQREQQIVTNLGESGWQIVCEMNRVICLQNGPGVLIKKNNHSRWVKPEQVKEENND